MGLKYDISLIEELVYLIRDDIFPNVYKEIVDEKFHHKKMIYFLHKVVSRDKNVVNTILKKIGIIKEELYKDSKFFFESDPACSSIEEVKLIYPGFLAILHYRIANIFYQLEYKIIARFISELAHFKTGIDINAGAKIGCPFFIDHGTGVVIGETSTIGNNVKMYHGVTLGASSLSKGRNMINIKRHPTIKDNVTIYSNSSIFGGDTIIGNNVIIGSGVIISSSIEDNIIVQKESEKIRIVKREKR